MHFVFFFNILDSVFIGNLESCIFFTFHNDLDRSFFYIEDVHCERTRIAVNHFDMAITGVHSTFPTRKSYLTRPNLSRYSKYFNQTAVAL